MTARTETNALQHAIFTRTGISIAFDDANTLRRAQITLQRWGEQECGNSSDFASYSIERDEETGLPYRCIYPHQGKMHRHRIADKEAGALRRVKEVCERNGLHFYHQGDPRGCALYVSHEPLPANDYTRGVACVV